MKKFIFLTCMIPASLLLMTGCTSLKSTGSKTGTTLAYHMSPGKSYTLKSETTSTITTEQMGQSVTIDMSSTGETLYRALTANPDGTTGYEMEYKAMKQSAKTPMGDNDTDFSSWIGKKVRFSVSPRGALSGFSGFDQLPELTTATGEKVTGEITQKGMVNQFVELPDHPVKTGDTWTANNSYEFPYAGGTLKQEETVIYTVAEKVNKDGLDCLKLNASGVEKLTGKFEQQGTELEMTRETKSTGIIYFAIEKGMYTSMEYTSTGSTQIYVPAASMTIPQDIKSKMSLVVVFK